MYVYITGNTGYEDQLVKVGAIGRSPMEIRGRTRLYAVRLRWKTMIIENWKIEIFEFVFFWKVLNSKLIFLQEH